MMPHRAFRLKATVSGLLFNGGGLALPWDWSA